MKILLAVDGSAFTRKAVKYLAAHFDWFSTAPELHLLHVVTPIPGGLALHRAKALLGADVADRYYLEEAQAALAPAEKLLRKHEIPFHSTYKAGDVADEVRAYAAKNKMDLIVMGSHGHGAIAGLVMGSAATKILAKTTVPVMIVR